MSEPRAKLLITDARRRENGKRHPANKLNELREKLRRRVFGWLKERCSKMLNCSDMSIAECKPYGFCATFERHCNCVMLAL